VDEAATSRVVRCDDYRGHHKCAAVVSPPPPIFRTHY